MTWFTLALACALFAGARDVATKKLVGDLTPLAVAWAMTFFAIPSIAIANLFEETPTLGENFYTILIAASALLWVNYWLYVKSISLSDVSLTVPMTSLSPLFLTIFAPLILGEQIGREGIIGILLIVAGAFFLTSKREQMAFRPFIELRRNPGPQLAMLVAFSFCFVAIFEKIGINNSAPLFWSISETTTIALIGIPVVMKLDPESFRKIFQLWKPMLLFGTLVGGIFITQSIAMKYGPVAYVIALKRLNILVAVIGGGLIFKEADLKRRFLGAAVMLSGVICIGLGS